MHVEVWHSIFALLEELPDGVKLFNVKGHATEKHVEEGLATRWELNGNQAADLMPRKGAWLHPIDDLLANVWDA